MPIYEYWCSVCRRVVSSYQQGFGSSMPACSRCGNRQLERRFSSFSVHKTYRDVYEDILSDRELVQGMMQNDPKALAEWNKRMSSGEKPPPEYEEIVERMEKGEWPAEEIEKRRKEFFGEGDSKQENK